jgi:hypothetical protein
MAVPSIAALCARPQVPVSHRDDLAPAHNGSAGETVQS